MEVRAPASGGLLGSLRGLADGLLGSAQERLELITLELHEEKYRLIQTLVWISAAVFSAMLTITFASLTIVYFFWDTGRLAVLGGLTVFYGIAFFVIAWLCRRFVARLPKPFEATIDELQEDRACIPPKS